MLNYEQHSGSLVFFSNRVIIKIIINNIFLKKRDPPTQMVVKDVYS